MGSELELFMFSPSVGPGFPLLLPKGALIRRLLEEFAYEIKTKYGLTFVWTPHVAKSDLYKQSKHWQKYDAMMPPLKIEEDEYTLKPMNCPHHFQVYLNKPWSYRELPLRLAENGTVYRFEKSGEINGLLRVRALTQDDSHWFVPHEMLAEEIHRALSLTKEIYSTFGLKNFYARISSHDPKNFEKYLGQKKTWENAEKALEEAVKKQKIQYSIGIGEAVFYGPKIDIMIRDSLGREWQVTTIQLDFNQPENFNLLYRDKDGQDKRPAILHVAIFGSIERFMAILIEHFAGAFPLWLSPVQVAVLPISDKQVKYAQKIVAELQENNIRTDFYNKPESIGKKIREAELRKIPYMLIVGEKEQKAKTVAVRARNQPARRSLGEGGKDLGAMKLDKFIGRVLKEIKNKSL
ncbi:MAG: threonine--tRNA ligase [Candidatus Doudnabacteria bacterium]|nr:threonine--tRNA ligase [Candidatus Doudnabacteria bacterium]